MATWELHAKGHLTNSPSTIYIISKITCAYPGGGKLWICAYPGGGKLRSHRFLLVLF